MKKHTLMHTQYQQLDKVDRKNNSLYYKSQPGIRPGFTLIDTLLGVSIFLVVSSAIFSLVFTTMAASRGIIERQKAANIAREGIEIMENIRNTNILRGISWASKPDNSTNYPADTLWSVPFSDLVRGSGELCITATYAQGNVPWKLEKINCPATNVWPSNTQLSNVQLSGKTLLGHGGTSETDAPKRYIKITNITSKLPQALQTAAITAQQGKTELVGKDDIMLIESVVQWSSKGKQQEEKLSKILTKWQ